MGYTPPQNDAFETSHKTRKTLHPPPAHGRIPPLREYPPTSALELPIHARNLWGETHHGTRLPTATERGRELAQPRSCIRTTTVLGTEISKQQDLAQQHGAGRITGAAVEIATCFTTTERTPLQQPPNPNSTRRIPANQMKPVEDEGERSTALTDKTKPHDVWGRPARVNTTRAPTRSPSHHGPPNDSAPLAPRRYFQLRHVPATWVSTTHTDTHCNTSLSLSGAKRNTNERNTHAKGQQQRTERRSTDTTLSLQALSLRAARYRGSNITRSQDPRGRPRTLPGHSLARPPQAADGSALSTITPRRNETQHRPRATAVTLAVTQLR